MFEFIKEIRGEDSMFTRYMKDAVFLIPPTAAAGKYTLQVKNGLAAAISSPVEVTLVPAEAWPRLHFTVVCS